MKNKKQKRHNFRKMVFERDHFKCVFCENNAVDAHHITDRNEMPNGGYILENGISLCENHHRMAEKFHETKGEFWFEGFHPDDLYKKINSSKELAIKIDKLNIF
jgi:predicted restriction endonuclease